MVFGIYIFDPLWPMIISGARGRVPYGVEASTIFDGFVHVRALPLAPLELVDHVEFDVGMNAI